MQDSFPLHSPPSQHHTLVDQRPSLPSSTRSWVAAGVGGSCPILPLDSLTVTKAWLHTVGQGQRLVEKKKEGTGVPIVAQWLTNPTTNHDIAGSIPGLAQWVNRSGTAVSCGEGRRPGSGPALLWLWRRLAATAPISPLAWEPPYAAGAAQEMAKRQKKRKKEKKKRAPSSENPLTQHRGAEIFANCADPCLTPSSYPIHHCPLFHLPPPGDSLLL